MSSSTYCDFGVSRCGSKITCRRCGRIVNTKNKRVLAKCQLKPLSRTMPSIGKRLETHRQAIERWNSAGGPVRDDAEVELIRSRICPACEHWRNGACGICGCLINLSSNAKYNKARMATESCPHPRGAKWGPPKKWAIGVTTAPRKTATLERTLASLAAAGFDSPHLFADGYTPSVDADHYSLLTTHKNKIGGWPNFLLALTELTVRQPQADYFAVIQDDVVFSANLRAWLEWQQLPPGAGVYSVFTPACYSRNRAGWFAVREGFGQAAAQTFVFPRERAFQFLSDPFVNNYRRNPPQPRSPGKWNLDGTHHIDGVVGEWCKRNKLATYFHAPSLAQHVGHDSAMYPGRDRSKKSRRIYADRFLGERFDLLWPTVFAVMITGKSEERRSLAADAVADFRKQNYQQRHLLIINDSGRRWFDKSDDLTEVVINCDEKMTLGELRNRGIGISQSLKADLVIQWDDDDRYRRDRITTQVAHWRPGNCVVLQKQIRRHTGTGKQFIYDQPGRGIEGTILHEVANSPKYPHQSLGEDTVFWGGFAGRIVVDNEPELYLRQYHGGNSWDEAHIMRQR